MVSSSAGKIRTGDASGESKCQSFCKNASVRIDSIKKGSIIVDAAIIIPVFILAFAALLSLINLAGYEAKAYASMMESESAACKLIALSGLEETPLSLTSYTDSGIRIDNILTDFRITQKEVLSESYRPFVGQSDGNDLSSYRTVYICPRYGTVYHTGLCWALTNNNVQYESVTKKEALSRGFTRQCGICSNKQ